MSYFSVIKEYQTYANQKDDFHFNYNANSGGGQAFLGGRYFDSLGQLNYPTDLNGFSVVFKIPFRLHDDMLFLNLGNCENAHYTIKPRGTGSQQMKISVGNNVSPSRLISAFFMLPITCGVKKPLDLSHSVLSSNNYWLQSMWLKCEKDDKNKIVYFIPRDFIFAGGEDKNNRKTLTFYEFDYMNRILDTVQTAKNIYKYADILPKDAIKMISYFGDLYEKNNTFNYEEARSIVDRAMDGLASLYPEIYSGITDPLIFIEGIIRKNESLNEVHEDINTLRYNAFHKNNDIDNFPYNWILFGAPGTGKSWELNERMKKLLNLGGKYERVTFHPDYTYSQFIGTYKPTTDNNGNICYQFVPGPFMRIYVRSLQSEKYDNPKPCLLIIEEINRARVSGVFGDIFQLLDRKEDGTSQYEIQTNEDIKKYLANELGGNPSDYPVLKLPNNMFLWATMNSADQGVYPMDTAFKRRWTFEYISIDAKQEEVKCTVNLVKDNPETNVNWNRLRKAINAKLLDTCRVNEDKLLGPFFLSKKAIKADEANHIIDEEAFRKAFKSKVIMYLFEDAARQYRSRLFKSDICKMYSSICDEFDKHGMAIFGDDFKSAYYDQQKD